MLHAKWGRPVWRWKYFSTLDIFVAVVVVLISFNIKLFSCFFNFIQSLFLNFMSALSPLLARSLADQRVAARRESLARVGLATALSFVLHLRLVCIFSGRAVGAVDAAGLTSLCSVYASNINSTATMIFSKNFFRFILDFSIKKFSAVWRLHFTLLLPRHSFGFQVYFGCLIIFVVNICIHMSMYMYKYACRWLQN